MKLRYYIFISLSIILTVLAIKFDNGDYNLSKDEIIEKSKNALEQYPYSLLKINIVKLVGDEEYQYQYTVSGEKDKLFNCVEYADFNNEEIRSNLWYYSEEDELYKIYTYDKENDLWFMSTEEQLPVSFEMYNIFGNMSNYELQDKFSITDNYGKCYELRTVIEDDNYNVILESILIDKDTFLPKVIITQGLSNTRSEEVKEDNISQVYQYYDEDVVKYEFKYSDSSLHFYKELSSFLNYNEYVEFINSKEDVVNE